MKAFAEGTKVTLPDLSALEGDKSVRWIAEWGRVHLDRPLPWIGVVQTHHEQFSSDRTLIEGWPAYFIYSTFRPWGEADSDWGEEENTVFDVLRTIVEERRRRFGAFLVLELRLRQHPEGGATVRVRSEPPHPDVVSSLVRGLEGITRISELPHLKVDHRIDPANQLAPPARIREAYWLTIDLDPLHYDPETGRLFPMISRSLELLLDSAARCCCFEFAHRHTTLELRSPAAVGRRHLLTPEWGTDRALTRINESFDLLLNITPVNTQEAWREFVESDYQKKPQLRYRPINVDPEELRRSLFQIPIHHTEDPTLAVLFRAEQEGIDQKLRMLEQRDTSRFIFDSLHLYGTVDDELLANALNLLNTLGDDPPIRQDNSIDAQRFSEIAAQRVAQYRQELPALASKVQLRDDIASVMVAQGNLLVPKEAHYPLARLEALLAHEVDTHIVTYYNGRAQPLKLLASGLSRSDELQEGLAVLAEALTGQLTEGRLRLLAARVLAVHRLVQKADFVDVYRELVRVYSFAKRTAFGITLRVFRGGGFTKDVIYLRGLQNLLDYLATGRPLDRLLVGKLAFSHISLINQLLERGVLQPPALVPFYLRHTEACERLDDLKQDQRLYGLIQRRAAC